MKHYEKHYESIILRDYLALDRTKLANERTLLGYIRTFFSTLAMGFGLINFTYSDIFIYTGVVLCAVSPLFLVVGVYRFLVLKKGIKTLETINREGKGG